MRERYLESFDRVWIDSLNGDKYKTGKVTPEGRPDPGIFSTETNREGIRVGTAVALLVRKRGHNPARAVAFRNLWGQGKRADRNLWGQGKRADRNLWGQGKRAELLADATDSGRAVYQEVMPAAGLGLPFVPLRSEAGYLLWPLLPELFPISFPGVKTSRDDVLVDMDRDRLVRRMEQYLDLSLSDEEMRRIAPGAMESTARFKAEAVRAHLRRRGFLPDRIVRYAYRPFDVRWLYWKPETKPLDEKREETRRMYSRATAG